MIKKGHPMVTDSIDYQSMTIKDRLLLFAKKNNISVNQIIRDMDVSRSYFQNLVNSPSVNKLNKVLEKHPNLNQEWLLTGKGPMTIIGDSERFAYRHIPLFSIEDEGDLSIVSQKNILRIIPFEYVCANDIALLQTDESMYPTIPRGSIMVIREVKTWREYFGFGHIYVIVLTDGRRIVKEVNFGTEDSVRLVSHNKNYGEELLPKSMIRAVWRVIKIQIEVG